MRILVADHDATMVESTARALSDDFVVDVATTKMNCLAMLDVSEYHVIVAAERLTDGSGLELLSQAGKRWPDVLRVLAIEPDRVHLLAGRLKPFKLFETVPYPIDSEKLRNVLLLAQAAEDAHVDTLNVQHIVLEDEFGDAAQQPVAAASAAPAPPQAHAPQPTRAPAQRPGNAPPTARRAPASAPPSQPPIARSTAPSRQAAPGGGRGSARAAPPSRAAGASRGAPAPPSRAAPAGGQRAAAVPPSGRARLSAAVGFESPAPAAPSMPGALNRRVGDRRAGSERRGTISVNTEPETFAGADTLAEAAEIAASLRPRLDAPDVFGKRRTMMFVAAGLGLALVAVAAAMMFGGDDAPVAATPAALANSTLPPLATPEPAVPEPQQLALASVPMDPATDPATAGTFKSSDPPEVAAFVADIESALTRDDFARARGLLDTLREIAPDHPRLAFFTALIARGEELQAALDANGELPEPPTLGPAIRTSPRKPDVAPAKVQAPSPPAMDREVDRKRAASLRALAPPKPAPAVVSAATDTRRRPSSALPAPAAPASDTRLRQAATPPAASLAPSRTPASASAPASTFSGRTLEENGRPASPSGSAQPRTIVLPVVKEARLLKQVDPEYPREAQREGVEGSIELRLTVKADGKVADIEVVQADPADIFERAAISAVRRWRYEPRREDGVAVDSRTRVRLEFRLDGQNRRR